MSQSQGLYHRAFGEVGGIQNHHGVKARRVGPGQELGDLARGETEDGSSSQNRIEVIAQGLGRAEICLLERGGKICTTGVNPALGMLGGLGQDQVLDFTSSLGDRGGKAFCLGLVSCAAIAQLF